MISRFVFDISRDPIRRGIPVLERNASFRCASVIPTVHRTPLGVAHSLDHGTGERGRVRQPLNPDAVGAGPMHQGEEVHPVP
jgi:hypothetical protein